MYKRTWGDRFPNEPAFDASAAPLPSLWRGFSGAASTPNPFLLPLLLFFIILRASASVPASGHGPRLALAAYGHHTWRLNLTFAMKNVT